MIMAKSVVRSIQSHEERNALRLYPEKKQARRMVSYNKAFQGSAFCNIPAGFDCAVRIGGLSCRRSSSRSIRGERNHGRCSGEEWTRIRFDRTFRKLCGHL